MDPRGEAEGYLDNDELDSSAQAPETSCNGLVVFTRP